MKRFWTDVSLGVADGVATVLLDGRPMRLPGGPALRLAPGPLADAIAAEWSSAGTQGEPVAAEMLPLTRLAASVQERVAPDPGPTTAALARYGETDALCYRSPQPALQRQQRAQWDPWLDWADRQFAARLLVQESVTHRAQPPLALARLAAAVAALTPHALAGLGVLVPSFGSLVLGLAVAHGRLDPVEALALADLEERFQATAWGEDAQAAARRAAIAQDVAAAGRFMALAAAG